MKYINPVLILRILQAAIAFIAMALGATAVNAINTADSDIPVPAALAFFTFTAVFTMLLTVPYTLITPRYFPQLAHPMAMLSAEATTSVLWLGGFAAVADLLRKNEIVVDAARPAARGCVAVGVFECVLFGVTTFFAFSHVFLGGRFSAANKVVAEKPESHRSWLGAQVV